LESFYRHSGNKAISRKKERIGEIEAPTRLGGKIARHATPNRMSVHCVSVNTQLGVFGSKPLATLSFSTGGTFKRP
jgi:hypothetical protein